MDDNLLKELNQQTGKPCVSILIPTEVKSFKDKEKLQLKLKKVREKVFDDLSKKYNSEAKNLNNSINSLMDQIDLNHLDKGVGLYVSEDLSKKVSFAFDVEEKIVVDNSFDTREISDYLAIKEDYFVLIISKNKCRLIKGSGKSLSEIDDDIFPVSFEHEFQVQRTDPHSQYNDEESKVNQARLDTYYRNVEKEASIYIHGSPLILMGVDRQLSEFRKIRKSIKNVMDEIHGNFDNHSLTDIRKLVYPRIEEFRKS